VKGRLRGFLVLTVLAAFAVAAWALFFRAPSHEYAFKTSPVARRDITALVSATGTLDSVIKVLIGSQVSGRLQKLYVDYNDRVRQGQVLAQIEPSTFRAKVDEAEAQIAKARANVADAQRTLKRIQELFNQRIGTQTDLDSARTRLQLAEADTKQAAATLKQAKVDLQNTTISSPIDGVIIARNVSEGQTVAASLSAPTLFTLADDLSRLWIVTNVDEADVGQVAEGQDVNFTVDAFPQTVFTGKVQLIRNSPVTLQGVVTYETIVQVDNPGQRLRPGMTANVGIVVAKKKHALSMPNAALRYRPPEEFTAKAETDEASQPAMEKKKPGGKKQKSHVTVWVLRHERPAPVRIKVGVTDGSYAEVKEGLQEKELVIVATQTSGAKQSGTNPLDPKKGKKLLP